MGWLLRCTVGYGAGDGIGSVRGEAAYNFSRDEIGNFFFWALLRSIYKNPKKCVISSLSQESY